MWKIKEVNDCDSEKLLKSVQFREEGERGVKKNQIRLEMVWFKNPN